MPLTAYGVLLGSKVGYHRDAPNNFGKFFHGHIDVQTPGQLYNTAIDVDSERPGVQVQWKVVPLRVGEWAAVFGLPDGFHPLASNDTSGAVDYYRDTRVHNFVVVPVIVAGPVPWWRRLGEAWRLLLGHVVPELTPNTRPQVGPQPLMRFRSRAVHVVDLTPPWKTGTDVQALTDLEAMLVDAPRVVIFGQSYPAQGGRPPGLHDIHQNQGDPPGPFQALDGIWQDGMTIAIHSDGTASAFLNKFSTQAMETDEAGLPKP